MISYNVLLVCAAGMSSSLLESKIQKAAEAQNHTLTIRALSVNEVDLYDFAANPVDIILIAPQVRYKVKGVAKKANPYGIIVQDIESMTFGMADGEKLFEQIKQAVPK